MNTGVQRQQGFVNLQIAVLLIFLALTAGSLAVWAREKARSDGYKAQGQLLKVAGNTLNSYIVTYYDNLQKGTPIAGVANIMAPTTAELKALPISGALPGNFSENSLYSTTQLYKFMVERRPAGCTPPACDLVGKAYLSTPFTDPTTGHVQASGLGEAAEEIGADGAYSDENTPSNIYGFGGAWSEPNPVGNVAGILAMRTGYGSSGFSVFTRRDGSAPPTADWDFNAKSISNLNTIQFSTIYVADATCPAGMADGTAGRDASGALLSCQGGVWKLQGSKYWKDPVASYAALPFTDAVGTVRLTLNDGRAYSWTGSTWKALAVDQNGNFTVPGIVSTGKLDLEDVSVEGAACPKIGRQSRDSSGLPLSCQSGIWTANNQWGCNAYGCWLKYASGLLYQWGFATADAGGVVSVTFPVPFPNNPLSYGAIPRANVLWNDAITVQIDDTRGDWLSKSGFSMNTRVGPNLHGLINVSWYVIGN